LGSRVKFGQYDANLGTVLKGNGHGDFKPVTIDKSGLLIKGEVRDIVAVKTSKGEQLLLWARNNDGVLVYKLFED